MDGYNRTALHYAAEKDEGCVELLLEYGALPNALDGNKDTPLHWAAFKDNPECVRALLESGACPNVRDYNNDTPLSWAAMKGNLESVRVLLEYGAQVHVTNLKGQTPISRLVALLARGLGTEQEEECLELLCRAAGRFEIRRADGSLPRELTKDPQLLARLTNLVAQPPSLRALARCAVRNSLGVQFLPSAVKQLPLPESVKEYVLLRDWARRLSLMSDAVFCLCEHVIVIRLQSEVCLSIYRVNMRGSCPFFCFVAIMSSSKFRLGLQYDYVLWCREIAIW